jgi:hydroxymethylpyrimidine/phosphomethylpyrimidine kinase
MAVDDLPLAILAAIDVGNPQGNRLDRAAIHGKGCASSTAVLSVLECQSAHSAATRLVRGLKQQSRRALSFGRSPAAMSSVQEATDRAAALAVLREHGQG